MTVYKGAKGLAKLAAKRKQTIDKVAKAAFVEVGTDVIMRTPVDQGTARGSWTFSRNSTNPAFSESFDKQGDATVRKLAQEANKGQVGDTFYLLSNLVYMPVLEYGSSDQAPRGMVRISIDNFNRWLAEAIKNVD